MERDGSIPPTRRSVGGETIENAPETIREPQMGLPGIGQVVAGRYRIERLVGSGGMAHVLAARHVQLGHLVAIKVVDPSLVDDDDVKERFAREARAMAALSSDHVVRVHDVGALPSGLPFMVMDLLEGKDLSHVLAERGRLPFDEACSYIDQACEAVDEAHRAGLVHRDLKPQNLFLTIENGRSMVRVLDFGIARVVGGGRMGKLATLTRVGDVIGTLTYMAPEQIRDSHSVEPRTDIWALGACLYRLITGKPPFTATSDAGLAEAILVRDPTPISNHVDGAPSVLVSVILRCLRKTPKERFATVRDLRNALAEVRAIMAVEPFVDSTEPNRRAVSRAGGPKSPSERNMEAMKETYRAPSGPRLAAASVQDSHEAKHETTARMPTPAGPASPLMREPSRMAAPTPIVREPRGASMRASLDEAPARPVASGGSSKLVFVIIVLAVAVLVAAGGLFVLLLSPDFR